MRRSAQYEGAFWSLPIGNVPPAKQWILVEDFTKWIERLGLRAYERLSARLSETQIFRPE